MLAIDEIVLFHEMRVYRHRKDGLELVRDATNAEAREYFDRVMAKRDEGGSEKKA